MNQAYRPGRTCLSVPGSSQKMIAKAKTLPADEVFLDLEHAVHPMPRARPVGEQPEGYDVGDAYHHALMTILIAARAHGIAASDGPYLKVRDIDAFRRVAGVDPRGLRLAHIQRGRGAWRGHAGDEMIDEASDKMAQVIAAKGRAAGMQRRSGPFVRPSG